MSSPPPGDCRVTKRHADVTFGHAMIARERDAGGTPSQNRRTCPQISCTSFCLGGGVTRLIGMKPEGLVPQMLLDVARSQGWIVSAEQCRMAGFSERRAGTLCRQGRWTRVAHGIYCIRIGGVTTEGLRWAALLAGGPGSALAGRTAGELWGILKPSSSDPVVLLPPGVQRRGTGPWQTLRTSVPFRAVGDPPRTTLERTAVDLCRESPEAALGLLADAVNTRRTTPARIVRELEQHSRFPQRASVKGILGDVEHGALSYLELKYLRLVERAHNLPRGQRQSRGRGGLRDVRYGRLVVELDGRLGHTGAGAFRDMRRDNLHLMDGELTLRFGLFDVEQRPCEAAGMVTAALHMLGQSASPTICGRGGCGLQLELRDIA